MESIVSYLLMLQKIYQFKAKDSEIKDYILCLGINSKDLTIYNMEKIGLKGSVNFFSVDYNSIDTNYIIDIHRYSLKENQYKIMSGIILKMFYCVIN